MNDSRRRYVAEYVETLTTAKLVETISEAGKTRDVIRCSCGHINCFYRWSWAGHGIAKCKKCAGRIQYGTLKVWPGNPDTIIVQLKETANA